MDRSAGFSVVAAVLAVVFREVVGARLYCYLGAGNRAAPAHGPVDELRLEIHAADGPGQHCRRGSLAVFARGIRSLGGLLGDAYCSVCSAGQGIAGRETLHKTNIPICGMNQSRVME